MRVLARHSLLVALICCLFSLDAGYLAHHPHKVEGRYNYMYLKHLASQIIRCCDLTF